MRFSFRLLLLLASLSLRPAEAADFRPPSVPLVTHDPYFSIWSPADRLTDVETTHWTNKPHPLHSQLQIDGAAVRLMGAQPAGVPALAQEKIEVLPTRTIYHFGDARVAVTLTFLTPTLPASLDVLSRPVTYVVWEISSRDGRDHDVALSLDASPLLAVNTADQAVVGQRTTGQGWQALRVGSVAQPVLEKQGDDLRIDWGHAYVAAEDPAWKFGFADAAASPFEASATSASAEFFTSAPASSAPWLRATLSLGRVGAAPASAHLMLAYDDEVSLRYFDSTLRPYWRRHGADSADLITAAAKDYTHLKADCEAFDRELVADLTQIGGAEYAQIGALAYRQAFAGCKLAADAAGAPLFFPKENFSNGCIGTVDVIYPMMPIFYVFNPSLVRASLVPVLDYAASPRWKFDYAPHDLGRYPHATAQVYGGGERSDDRQMPVEESANMILLVSALAKVEGRLDLAEHYWPQLEKWAHYLEQKGFDPENQLCTDDFAGHLAHNVNLSAKAIVALGAYAQLCEQRKLTAESTRLHALAKDFAARWTKEALSNDHYRLAFDQPNTWSQKYNLVWDRVLGLGLFDAATLRREIDFYLKTQAPYGLPLDSRSAYTKLDWILWTASLTGNRADQDALVKPIYRFLNATPDRVPMTDWYFTDSAKMRGFRARPVVGGVFMPMLADAALTQKWSTRADRPDVAWAPFPLKKFSALAATSESAPASWRYTATAPGADWAAAEFSDAQWTVGSACFVRGQPNANAPANLPNGTKWSAGPLWMRREFSLDAAPASTPLLRVTHAGVVDVFVNGVLAAHLTGDLRAYENLPLSAAAVSALHAGRNVLALHVVSPDAERGRRYVDAGLIAPASK